VANLFERMGFEAPKAAASESTEVSLPTKGRPVSKSPDLYRIKALPTRDKPTLEMLQGVADAIKNELSTWAHTCVCESHFKKRCCKELLPIQAWALHEIAQHEGLLGPIGVGHGKTLIGLLAPFFVNDCKTALLLVPPGLRDQLLRIDWEFYSQHWKLPNLAGSRFFTPGRPMLHVVAFTQLQGKKHGELLEKVKPDFIIVDEAHSVSRPEATRTKRLNKYLDTHPEVRFACWSGTLTRRSLGDWASLSKHALGKGSPAPLAWNVIEEWKAALDPANFRAPIGALVELRLPGETIEEAMRRRRITTPGVVATGDEDSCQASLIIQERVLEAPEKIRSMLKEVGKTWERPDGELLIQVLDVAACERELSAGFYYHWEWPRKEPLEVRQRWLKVRREYHQELRARVSQGGVNMDSPSLCEDAAKRWHEGYKFTERDEAGNVVKTYEIAPKTKRGPLPVWQSEHWVEWQEVEPTAKPQSATTWVDNYLVLDAAAWLEKNVGVAWYLHTAFGIELERVSGFPRYGAGKDASRDIVDSTGRTSIIASIKAHGTGKNLQMFDNCLIANPPAAGDVWEQLLGRHHRGGQLSDEVNVHVYRHTESMRDAVERARELAQYIQDSWGSAQKLVSKAEWRF